MKSSSHILSSISIGLGLLALVVSCLALARAKRPTNSPENSLPSVDVSQQSNRDPSPVVISTDDLPDLHTLGFVAEDCPNQEPEVYVRTQQFILFHEVCANADGTIWKYDITANTLRKQEVHLFLFGGANFPGSNFSFNKRYQIVLGPREADNEVRTLQVKDFFSDMEKETDPLPASLTYRNNDSEYYGSPYGIITWTEDGWAYAEVYGAMPKSTFGDQRFPLLKQFVDLHMEENGGVNALPVPSGTELNATTTILVSTKDAMTYCNGADMDSAGYRQTITKKQDLRVPMNQTVIERARSVIAATSGSCGGAIDISKITLKDKVIHIPPFDGWAGVSIAMCSCKPTLEVNVLHVPGIERVVWDTFSETH